MTYEERAEKLTERLRTGISEGKILPMTDDEITKFVRMTVEFEIGTTLEQKVKASKEFEAEWVLDEAMDSKNTDQRHPEVVKLNRKLAKLGIPEI